MRFLLLLPILAIAACSPGMQAHTMAERRATLPASALPPMKRFTTTNVSPPSRSNTEIARDFLDLSFKMESGRTLPIMTRFEGPITVRVTGSPPASLEPDLKQLLTRLRREANIPISRVGPAQSANITIEVIPRAQLQRLVPQAACFVVPRTASWAQYRKQRRSGALSWATLKERDQIAIFLPGDVSPQEVRDCLHEELAQALGPLNDLYRLPDSVFNDDNFQTVLTGFDMLILRIYYAPEMHNGMTRSQAAVTLPRVLARLNPHGQRIASRPQTSPTSRAWIDAIEAALGPKGNPAARRKAATTAVTIAQNSGWNDTRLAFSLYALGRLSLSTKTESSLHAFLNSGAIYMGRKETQIQAAHVAMQLAAFTLSAGEGDATLKLVNTNLPAVAASKNAALLATLLMIKAEALEMVGRASEAHEVRIDSLGWARYGFGSDKAVRGRLAEISALAPVRKPQSTRSL
ncbi:MAG: ATP-dependent transcriptional regulator [Marinosulfonomonas sp.]|nr:MAG: ATP-dependent transcriptional regulator [Marinosulfonomonas sp.]